MWLFAARQHGVHHWSVLSYFLLPPGGAMVVFAIKAWGADSPFKRLRDEDGLYDNKKLPVMFVVGLIMFVAGLLVG